MILDLVHGCNINRLNEVLKLLHLLTQLLDGHLLILHGAHDLEFLDTVTNRNQLGGAPHKTLHLDGLDGVLHGIHVSLVVPWLHVEEDRCLGDHLGLLGFLLMVGLESLLGDLCFSASSSSSSEPNKSTS